MSRYDILAPGWIRLKKGDGHLGALFHPERGVIRFIGSGGTVDYNLVNLSNGDYAPKVVTAENVAQER